jgi:hypothetical protein
MALFLPTGQVSQELRLPEVDAMPGQLVTASPQRGGSSAMPRNFCICGQPLLAAQID